MSSKIIYEQEIDFCCKKGKWKRCLCTIQIISRIDNILCAILKESENLSIIEKIDIYGYECGVNGIGFVFIGKKDCYSIRFKDIDRMLELETCLKKYIFDVSYFMQFDDCTKDDSGLVLKEWYRFHVQLFRICLTLDTKTMEIIKVWSIFQVDEIKRFDSSLSMVIKTDKDRTVYTFHHDNKKVVDKIYNALLERRYTLPGGEIHQNHFTKRKSETADLKRFNSCSNSREMKANSRTRNLSSSETASYDYDVSMPSTPAYRLINAYDANSSSRNNVNVNEDAEPLVFQMDSVDCGSVDSNGVYGGTKRTKSNSMAYDSASIESESMKKVDLERFPFEAEIKNKTNISSSSNLKDVHGQVDNISVILKPNNGNCYQALSYLKNHYKTLSEVNLESSVKLPSTNENKVDYHETRSLFSDNKCSSSSFLHTPSPSSNTSYENQTTPLTKFENQSIPLPKYENQSIPLPKYDNQSTPITKYENQSIPVPKSNSLTYSDNVSNYIKSGHTFPNHNYYNMSSHFNCSVNNHKSNNSHKYYNLTNSFQSEPVDIKPAKVEEKKLNYIQLDFGDCPNIGNLKIISNNDFDNYKEIDIKNTEALKSLDGILFTKPAKKSFFRYLFPK